MTKRLIETAFPLAETSAASLHEKNIRHGHISTMHLWPARRPLAASRAALVAALLSDPQSDAERNQLVRKLGGTLSQKTSKVKDGKEQTKVEGHGGILWWGQESGPDLKWFRDSIRASNGGSAPRVLDPFAGGGAIPLEAMRLGCKVEAQDLNPVAWLILKCTLEYPQRLGGERKPLPAFILRDRPFMESFLKAQGFKGARLTAAVDLAAGEPERQAMLIEDPSRPWQSAGLSWHVRAWGQWVLGHARQALAAQYPTYAEWATPLSSGRIGAREAVLLTPDDQGVVDVASLNTAMTPAELADFRQPRWVSTPTVAYLWARTVKCKSCRASIPLLKTRWLCRRVGKRVRLTMEPNSERNGVVFKVDANVAVQGAGGAAKRAADVLLGGGNMSRAGAKCPCCPAQMTMEEIRFEGRAKRLGSVMTAVVVDGLNNKEYRDPTPYEITTASIGIDVVDRAFEDVPFGKPSDLIPLGSSRSTGGSAFSTPGYGFTHWADLFTSRQLLTMATLTREVRRVHGAALTEQYPPAWAEALWAYLALANDRVADRSSTIAHWDIGRETVVNTFSGFRLPMSWDFAECVITGDSTGSYAGAVDWIGKVTEHVCEAAQFSEEVKVHHRSALRIEGEYDAIITDPPYYDAIPYSDLMDFFYIWLRRAIYGLSDEVDKAFGPSLSPKWDHEANDGELVDDSSRFNGDRSASKINFEDGMANVFRKCHSALATNGIIVVVFANKNPDAWETLVGAIIRAGFVVEGSLPIQTEMGNRTRAQSSAALSSSVWLVCRKRAITAKPGYDRPVLAAMKANIGAQMRRFWDAGIRGPDFLWAATGPGLEAYSQHPIVLREATASGKKSIMPVAEFLREVRHLVVEFAVGRVLHGDSSNGTSVGLDDVTTYYLLHRQSFGMSDAPAGAAILYAMSCGLTDSELTDRWELLASGKSQGDTDGGEENLDNDDVEDGSAEVSGGGSGGTVRLRPWVGRTRKALGQEGVGGKSVPLIDRVHRLMWLWKGGDVGKVDAYIDQSSISRDPLFAEVLQAVIALAQNEQRLDEAALLEAISNHVQSRQGFATARQAALI